MERHSNVHHNPMWLLIPILCFLQATANEQFIPNESTLPNGDGTNLTKSSDGRLNHDNELPYSTNLVKNLNDSGFDSEMQSDPEDGFFFMSDSDLIVRSDPIVEEIPENTLLLPNRRRDVPDRGFPSETKEMILKLHNSYRGNVIPPAGNMALLEWDTELEYLAQLWANGCDFNHGNPPNTTYRGGYGQNLYLGADPTGQHGIGLWFDEYNYYDLETLKCDPNQQCGHYMTMGYAESVKLGCGVTKCGLRYLIVCHYSPPLFKGKKMYTVGKPCSQCPSEEGSLCLKNLCVTWDQCDRNLELCGEAECNLKCRNCGRLDKEKCKCECADGWDSSDCSRLCTDEHERCGVTPGFPNQNSCYMSAFPIAKKHCRKMCQSCNTYEEGSKADNVCCNGKLCAVGHILDTKSCACKLLCPGLKCNYTNEESSGESLRYNFVIVIYFLLLHVSFYIFNL